MSMDDLSRGSGGWIDYTIARAIEWPGKAFSLLCKGGILANYIIAILIILSLNFLLPRMMPGDPLQAIYGDEALVAMTPQLEADLIHRFGLDLSIDQQFIAYLSALAHGDLGYSYYYGESVSQVILAFLPWTILLAGSAMMISTAIGLLLGMESGYRRGQPLDKLLLAGVIFLSGLPDFFIGILLLIVFGVSWRVLPLSGALTPYGDLHGTALALDLLRHLAAPLAALVIVRMTSTYLLTRNSMIATLGERYIVTARGKGCSERRIQYMHAGRNSLLPVVTSVGLHLPNIVTGALFVEIVFAYPGVGWLLYNSILSRDYPLIQGILLMVTLSVLTVNMAVDLAYRRLDPRVGNAH